jgi:MoaA/NifB/PqqE/SkfB family radical SAM enzyme
VVDSHGFGRKSAVVTKVTDLRTELVQPGIVGRFDAVPLLVIWEITQACDLACAHCRASAVPCRNPDELTTEEGFRLLAEVRSFGEPLMISPAAIPSSDPMSSSCFPREFALACERQSHRAQRPQLNREAMSMIQRTGVSRMAVSLDGADEISHDGFRGVHVSFHRTLAALTVARELGLETQVNSTVTRRNLGQLEKVAR